MVLLQPLTINATESMLPSEESIGLSRLPSQVQKLCLWCHTTSKTANLVHLLKTIPTDNSIRIIHLHATHNLAPSLHGNSMGDGSDSSPWHETDSILANRRIFPCLQVTKVEAFCSSDKHDLLSEMSKDVRTHLPLLEAAGILQLTSSRSGHIGESVLGHLISNGNSTHPGVSQTMIRVLSSSIPVGPRS